MLDEEMMKAAEDQNQAEAQLKCYMDALVEKGIDVQGLRLAIYAYAVAKSALDEMIFLNSVSKLIRAPKLDLLKNENPRV